MSEASDVKSNQDYLAFQCFTLCDFASKEDCDLSFTEGEVLTITGVRSDGWWKAKNKSGSRGLVPSNFLKVTSDVQDLVNRALELEREKMTKSPSWKTTIKKDFISILKEDQIKFPAGFQQSILFKAVNKSHFYHMGNFMLPKLDVTGLSFQDLKSEYSLSWIKPSPALLQRKIILIAARQIPEPPKGFVVKSRHIRMCLHDGNEILSNVHTIKAKWQENSPKLWTFNIKITSRIPCIEDGEIFIRSDRCVPTLGILFELCIKYENNAAAGEMSAGWAFMKLLDDSGIPINSTTKILKVGVTEPFTPYFSSAAISGVSGFFKKIINEQKLPRIVVSVAVPDRVSNKKLSFFPSTLIGPWCCIPIITLCCKVIAEDILEKVSSDSTDRIQSPLLSSLRCVFNELDLVDILRICRIEKITSFGANDNKEENSKKKAFQDLYLETVFVMLSSNDLPPYAFGDVSSENERKAEIERLSNIWSQHRTLSLSSEVEFSPLSIDKLSTKL